MLRGKWESAVHTLVTVLVLTIWGSNRKWPWSASNEGGCPTQSWRVKIAGADQEIINPRIRGL